MDPTESTIGPRQSTSRSTSPRLASDSQTFNSSQSSSGASSYRNRPTSMDNIPFPQKPTSIHNTLKSQTPKSIQNIPSQQGPTPTWSPTMYIPQSPTVSHSMNGPSSPFASSFIRSPNFPSSHITSQNNSPHQTPTPLHNPTSQYIFTPPHDLTPSHAFTHNPKPSNTLPSPGTLTPKTPSPFTFPQSSASTTIPPPTNTLTRTNTSTVTPPSSTTAPFPCHTPQSTTPNQPQNQLKSNHRTSITLPTAEPASSVTMATDKAVSHGRLIQMYVDAFVDKNQDKSQEEFVATFLLVHQWFLSSEELIQAFINLFWISQFPYHFDLDIKLISEVERLRVIMEAEGNHKMKDLIDVSKIPLYDWLRNMSVRPSLSVKHARKVSLIFNHLEPRELAEQLTFLEYKAFRRIQVSDYKSYAKTACLKDQPKLERSIALFNGLSQWVQCMVLSRTTPQQRADVICKFINVSKQLKMLQNFNTLMAIVGGLCHSALARLTKTVSCLTPEYHKTLSDLADLVTSNNNFTNYRKVYQQCHGFKIPILGVHLKDLIAVHTALPDKVDGDMLNPRKVTQLAVILRELIRFQGQETYPIDANMDLVNTLRLSLDSFHTEEEIYELSLAREPRGSLPSPTTPTTKTAVFADWLSGLSGVSPPDPNIINKHVNDMVEAVFKNYDQDRNGVISHEEFDAIAGNFPFIDSFCVLDTDQDGLISKDEMKTYFIRANCHALRNSFKHDFHETTYFKLTFCSHCTGLLWGVIKQGWKCKDCGINAHRHCKDMVVMECRSKVNRRTGSVSNETEPDILTVAAKWKMTQRGLKRLSASYHNQATQTERILRRASSLTEINSTRFKSRQLSAAHNGDFNEEPTILYERLFKVEEARDKLIEENTSLQAKLELAYEEVSLLKSQIVVMRENTIAFILEQMDALQMQRDTDV